MIRRTTVGLGLAVAILSGGCGTLANVKNPNFPPDDSPNAPLCRVYGGVRGDWAIMTDYPWAHPPSYLDYVVVPVMAALDLTIALATDTLTLPYTAGVEIRREFGNPPPPPAPPPTTAPPAKTAASAR